MTNDRQERGSDNGGRYGTGRRRFLGAVGGTAVTASLAGCFGGIGGDDDVFRIGHLAPTELVMGRGAARSAEIAVEELQDNGGINGQEIELLSVDTNAQPTEGERVTESLVQEEQVDLLVGTFVSEVTQGIIDFIAEMDVPFIITGSADPDTMTQTLGQDYDHYKNIFRTGPINSDFQAEGMANYANYLNEEYGWEDFAVLSDDAAWTTSFDDILPDMIEENDDLSVVYDDRMSVETEDFSPFLDNAESADADAVFRFIAHGGAAAFTSTWAQNEYPFALEGISVPGMSPEFWDQTEGASLYETTAQSGAGGVAELTDRTMTLVDAYEAEYADDDPPSKPMYMGFNSYDGILFYAEAVENAGTADYESDLDDIVDAMLDLEFTGAAGDISLYGADDEFPHDVRETRTDNDVISNFPVTQWQPDGDDGGVECVYPREDATAEHMAPDWI